MVHLYIVPFAYYMVHSENVHVVLWGWLFGHKSIFDLHYTQAQSQMWRCWIHNSLRECTIHLGPTLSGRSRIRNSLPHFLRRRNDVQVNSVWCMMNQQELFFGSLTDPPYLPQTLIPKLHLAVWFSLPQSRLHLAVWFSLPQSRLHLALHQSSLPLVLQFNLSHSRLNLAPWFRLIQFSPTQSRLPVLHAGQCNLSQVHLYLIQCVCPFLVELYCSSNNSLVKVKPV